MIMLIIWMAMDTTNSKLVTMVTFRSFFLFIARFVMPYLVEVNSNAIRRLIAPKATKNVRSEKVKGGSCIIYPSRI
jgi:hypothetical protein